MKGKSHFNLAFLIIIFIMLIFGWFVIKGNVDAPTTEGVILFILSAILFLIGSLLPDSDSENCGSSIYYTNGKFFGYLGKVLEFPLSRILKRERGHRQSLHTIFGIIATSLVFSLIIYHPINFYFDMVSIKWFFWFFGSLFLGQLIHLIGDRHLYLK